VGRGRIGWGKEGRGSPPGNPPPLQNPRSATVALALLDCSAAFDTVDHDILLPKLGESFGVNDTAPQWLTSYIYEVAYSAFDMVAVSRNI